MCTVKHDGLTGFILMLVCAIGMTLAPIALAGMFPAAFAPDCAHDRNTITQALPRGCR